MPEYIEREAALEALLNELCGTGYQSQAMRAVEIIPAADVEPVRHGRWITSTVRGSITLCCSECGDDLGSICETDRCPNCGTKMDLK